MAIPCTHSLLSGKFGAVFCSDSYAALAAGTSPVSGLERIARISRWEVTHTAEDHPFNDSGGFSDITISQKTVCSRRRLAGVEELTGTLDYIFDTGGILYNIMDKLQVGQCCSLVLMMNTATPTNQPGGWIIREALFLSNRMEANINDGSPIGGSIDFASNGIFWFPGQLIPATPAIPTLPDPLPVL